MFVNMLCAVFVLCLSLVFQTKADDDNDAAKDDDDRGTILIASIDASLF